MRFELSQEFYFEAAHTLNREFDAVSSKRIHGHTYLAKVTIIGSPDQKLGMVTDLAFIRQVIQGIKDSLDHQFLDEVIDLGPPTLENLCKYIYLSARKDLPYISKITVSRSASGDSCSLKITT